MVENNEILKKLIKELKEAYYPRKEGASENTVNWADTAFKNLAAMISDEARAIGFNTIREIMTGRYVISENPNRIHTLDTIAMFLKYKNWNEFLLSTQNKYENIEEGIEMYDKIVNTVIAFNKTLLKVYYNLPVINTRSLVEFLGGETPFYEKILHHLTAWSSAEVTLSPKANHVIERIRVSYCQENHFFKGSMTALVIATEKLDIQFLRNNVSMELPHADWLQSKDYIYRLISNTTENRWILDSKMPTDNLFSDLDSAIKSETGENAVKFKRPSKE